MVDTVQLFATCLVDTLYPEVGESVVRILNRCGAKVEFLPWRRYQSFYQTDGLV